MRSTILARAALAAAACLPIPALAQDAGEPGVQTELPESTVYDGDYVSIGVGAAYGPSYSGSDDYVFFPLPVVQGSLGGVDFSPRAAGLAVSFVTVEPMRPGGPSFSGGIVGKLNFDRTNIDRIDDPVVESLGELDTAFEIGPTIGAEFAGVLNPFDGLTLTLDSTWDVAGAHDGMAISPAVTYFTPLSRGIAVSLSLSAKYIDDDYADYYYTVTPTQSAITGGVLPAYNADGGFESVGVNLLAGYDLDGELANGGLALIGLAGYSSMLGDAKRTPFTSVRGDADQWFFGAGIGYTF